MPNITCPLCYGGETKCWRVTESCKLCKGTGEVSEEVFENFEKELDEYDDKDFDTSKYFEYLFESWGLKKK